MKGRRVASQISSGRRRGSQTKTMMMAMARRRLITIITMITTSKKTTRQSSGQQGTTSGPIRTRKTMTRKKSHGPQQPAIAANHSTSKSSRPKPKPSCGPAAVAPLPAANPLATPTPSTKGARAPTIIKTSQATSIAMAAVMNDRITTTMSSSGSNTMTMARRQVRSPGCRRASGGSGRAQGGALPPSCLTRSSSEEMAAIIIALISYRPLARQALLVVS